MFLKKMLRFKNTLLFRLTILYAGAFALSSFLVFSIIYLKIHAVAIEKMDEELLHEIHEFTAVMSTGGIGRVKAALTEEMRSEDPNEEFYRIITFKGDILFSTDMSSWVPLDLDDVPETLRKGTVEHVYRTLTVPGRDHKARMVSAVIGDGLVLQFGETLDEVEDYLAIYRNWFFVLMIMVSILSAMIGWFMARRALRDVEEVTKTATDIANGAYDKRVQGQDHFEEIRQLGGAFNKMLDRIQNVLKLMKEVNDNIAHDLRSPLARIRGIAEMGLMGNKNDEEYRSMAVSTIEECDSLIDMVNTMLDITESESGAAESKMANVDLKELLANARELFRPIADSKEIAIAVNVPDMLTCYADRRKVQRVVSNLLDNAIKYTPEGGSISITATAREEWIQILLDDTGPGISAKDIPHIFDRFYRCDRSRTQSGVGLGLSLAKAFTESMHGSIRVDSTVNKGSRFTVHLPMRPSTGIQ